MACLKKKFIDKGDAMLALSLCTYQKGKRKEKRIYYCEKCKAFHLTSKTLKAFKKKVKKFRKIEEKKK